MILHAEIEKEKNKYTACFYNENGAFLSKKIFDKYEVAYKEAVKKAKIIIKKIEKEVKGIEHNSKRNSIRANDNNKKRKNI